MKTNPHSTFVTTCRSLLWFPFSQGNREFRASQVHLLVLVIAFLLGGNLVSPAVAASFYWVGGGSSASAPASGNWDASTTDWSTTATGSPTTAWGAAGSTAVFAGVDGTYNVSVNATVNKPLSMFFTNSGYTLRNATTPQTITINGGGSGAAPNITVAPGKIATIGTNITISAGGTTVIWGNNTGTGAGELDIANGGTLSCVSSSTTRTYGLVGVGAVMSVKTGGSLIMTQSSGTGGNFILGSTLNDDCTLSVDGGTVSFSGTSSYGVKIGGSSTAVALTGTLIVNGGSFSVTGSGSVTNGANAGNSGYIYLNGGLMTVNKISQGNGNGYMIFNGGALKTAASGSASTFLNGLSLATVRNNGGIIDNNGFNVTIGQALLNSLGTGFFPSDNAVDGGLIVTNSGLAGSLILTGANSYNGPTVIKSGAYLATTTASTGAGAYTVGNSATLEVQVPVASAQLAMSSLTEGASGNLTNIFTLGANASTTTPAVAVSGALALNGTVTVNVSGSGLTGPNSYLLLSYGSMTGSGSFVASSLPIVAGFVGVITNDTSAKQLKLIYAQAPQALSWAVGNGNWDTTTLNWHVLGTGSPLTNYTEGSLEAAFDDSASGSSPITVTLTGDHSASFITNNSTKNYVLAGNQSINSPQLIKNGSSTLTLDNGSGNSFGSIAINNGTLQIGNNDTNGSLGSAAIADSGTLQFSRTDSVTLTNTISGIGGVTQSGSGTVLLSGANSYMGNTVISAGTLTATTASIGAGAYSVADGATLGVQVGASSASLNSSTLTLGTSGSLTNNFTLGAFGSTTVPAVTVNGALALNGTVTVNVTGSGLTTGTYLLMSYGSISGSGSFVLASAPLVNGNSVSLINDTTAQQLKLVYTAVTALTWDAGNTANGTTIDAGSGTWDTNPNNLIWNDNGVNRSWANAVAATFGGTDGAWTINLAANVSTPALIFTNSGYTFTAAAPQTISFSTTGSGLAPNLRVAAGAVATIGTNVTVNGPGTTIWGNAQQTPGGELDIENGGKLTVAGTTVGQVGAGTVTRVKAGGQLIHNLNVAANLILGSQPSDNCTLSVDGGVVAIQGNSTGVKVGGNSAIGNVGGTLTINSGSFSMAAGNTGTPMTLGVNASNLGTNNLNGGVLSVNKITQGAGNGYINFNGGTLQAVNGAFGSTFLNGLTAANVRNGGAVINNNGFAITIGQALLHSTIVGDNATDGGLTVTGSGTLTLAGANTYTGNTTVNAGTLELVSPALATNSTVTIASGAILQLDPLATNTVAGLMLNGVSQSAGVYNSTTSPSYITGLGSLLIESAVATNPTNIVVSVSGGNLVLSWPADHIGWHLQAQTNSLSTGLGTNWVDVPSTSTVNSFTNSISPINGAVFYRLTYP
jgi:autotransporter-associated beta strand protein